MFYLTPAIHAGAVLQGCLNGFALVRKNALRTLF